ncbi:PAS domain S-box protein [Pontiella agarivorans]|uniref:histidine kinase n=1 Tax=Pontiella agarivorans TaxID=3038953 RepID=A0ABU5MVC9_9BACT|nr:PAS domain S-box protein [Pontiella agarivorans]MDZ8118175.1 PAS domain S-box protein [Pontiella agarivorans]
MNRLRWIFAAAGIPGTVMCAHATEPEQAGLLQAGIVGPVLFSAAVLAIIALLLWIRQLRTVLSEKSQALEKSIHHIELMEDHLPNVAIFQLTQSENGTFSFRYLSQGVEQILGVDHDRILADARLVYDHIYEDDLPRLNAALETSRTGSPIQLELRLLDQEGNLKWLYISAIANPEEGQLIWNGLIQDISLNKRVEDALIEENRNFQNLFETIDDLLLVCDLDGRLMHANPSVEKRLGYSHDELREMSLFELYPQEARDEVYRLMAYMQTERSTTANMPLQIKNGGSIPVEMSIFQGFWKNRKAVFGVARDIAGRQQTENARRESQRMLQLIMDSIPMSVFWKDKDSIYLGCNKTYIRECGLESLDSVVGQTPYDLFDPKQALAVVERDQDIIQNNHPLYNFTQSYARPDGSIAWREISKIPLRDEKGRAVGVLDVWHDVTEQNRAEERLKRTLEDMERFNQLMRGRERRTLELKAEVNELLQQLGQFKKYRTTTDDL